MATVYDSAARQRLHARIDALTPESKPRWGRMNVGQMIVHCDLQLRHSLGDLPLTRMTVPIGSGVTRTAGWRTSTWTIT